VRLLLDTLVLIFAVDSPERLSRRARTLLQGSGNILELSVISLSEIAIKASLGKLRVTPGQIQQAIQDLDLRILPFRSEHAFRLFELPLHHGDPFDRQIIAQAIAEKIPIVTSDEKFSLYDGLKVIW
jgi:PIN domain nuclease of toxin-antitoxin system